jgi:hypothetical protein
MNPAAAVSLGLSLLGQVLSFISSVKSQGGLTDDQILEQAQKITAGNDAAYQQLVSALTPTVVAAPPTTGSGS